MSARIAKGSQRPRPRTRSVPRGSARKAKAPGLFEQAGISPEAVRRMSWWIFLGMAAAVSLAAISAFEVPRLIGAAAGEAAGNAGFAVKRVEIKGAEHVPQIDVYNIAFDQPSAAMPLVDLDGIRARLLEFGWVAEARVSRRLPDTLVIDIVEREPAAIWQHEQRLHLIDREGVVLEAVRLEAMPDLPLVIGPAANLQAGALERLLEASPELRPLLAGATWVGGRRWDLRFHSGEALALPEGEEEAARALVRFAQMDRATQLLGRGLVRFDMRIPGKFVVRVSREPGSTVPVLEPEAPTPPADLARTI